MNLQKGSLNGLKIAWKYEGWNKDSVSKFNQDKLETLFSKLTGKSVDDFARALGNRLVNCN